MRIELYSYADQKEIAPQKKYVIKNLDVQETLENVRAACESLQVNGIRRLQRYNAEGTKIPLSSIILTVPETVEIKAVNQVIFKVGNYRRRKEKSIQCFRCENSGHQKLLWATGRMHAILRTPPNQKLPREGPPKRNNCKEEHVTSYSKSA